MSPALLVIVGYWMGMEVSPVLQRGISLYHRSSARRATTSLRSCLLHVSGRFRTGNRPPLFALSALVERIRTLDVAFKAVELGT